MIAPKVEKPSAKAEQVAYELATLRDGDTCLMKAWDCQGAVQRDHRQNRQPGNTVVENLQLLCMKHHDWKTGHSIEANDQGWGVPGWADPLTYPGRRWIRNGPVMIRIWVLYKHDGTWARISDTEARRRIDEGALYEEEQD